MCPIPNGTLEALPSLFMHVTGAVGCPVFNFSLQKCDNELLMCSLSKSVSKQTRQQSHTKVKVEDIILLYMFLW